MIKERTARRLAAKFFHEQELEDLARIAKGFMCVSSIFELAIKRMGKRQVIKLYRKLPEQLRYVFLDSIWTRSKAVNRKLRSIDKQFEQVRDSNRPERLKDFAKYMIELERVIVDYLKEGVTGSEIWRRT